MLVRLIFTSVLLLVLTSKSKAQMYLSDIDFEKIEHEAVEEFLHNQIENDVTEFSEVKASLTPTSSTDGYRCHEGEYVVKDSLGQVWEHYVSTNPAEAWNARKFSFGLLFSRNRNQVIYPHQNVTGIEPGQVIYLNLNVLKGLKKIATAFEIITVDEDEAVIEFSYIEDNITKGKQQLTFFTTPRGYTKIVHRSYFKSESMLRDHFIYPYFHTRLTNNYHRNMKKLYKTKAYN